MRRLAAELPVEVRIIRAPTIPPSCWTRRVELAGLPVEIVAEDRFAAIADSHLALCASGTATLEVGLLGTPMVMVYRLASWTYAAGQAPGASAQRQPGQPRAGEEGRPRADPGAGQPRADRGRGRAAAHRRRRARAACAQALAEVRGRLGEGGASGRAAGEVAAMLAGGGSGV